MSNDVVLTATAQKNLLAINRAQKAADDTSLHLATGKRINSALDQPQNFFTASSLTNRATDLTNILDRIQINIRSIEEALIGIEAMKKLLNQAEAIAVESQRIQRAGLVDPNIEEQVLNLSGPTLSTQILSEAPVAYYRLNDAGNPALNLGTAGPALNGTYNGGFTNGAAPLYTNAADVSTDFNGVDSFVAIPDSALINTVAQTVRTIEMVFEADTTAGRQVLYEEGGNSNAINMYIESGEIYFHVFDNGNFGPFTMNAPINPGQTYHATLVFDGPNSEYRGYLDGALVGTFPTGPSIDPHPGNVAIGSLRDQSFMHDGASPSNTFRFDGRISDVAIYNSVLSDADIAQHAASLNSTVVSQFVHRDFEKVMNELNQLIIDARYRGVNLLAGDDLRTDFNELRTNFLVTDGIDFSVEGLGIERFDFNDPADLNLIISSVRKALKEVRAYGNTLVNDIGVIQTRLDFNEGIINNHIAAAEELTIADMNEEGVNQLAANTRLQVAQTTLAGAESAPVSILQIIQGLV